MRWRNGFSVRPAFRVHQDKLARERDARVNKATQQIRQTLWAALRGRRRQSTFRKRGI
jgi:hypothetical protein